MFTSQTITDAYLKLTTTMANGPAPVVVRASRIAAILPASYGSDILLDLPRSRDCRIAVDQTPSQILELITSASTAQSFDSGRFQERPR